MVEHSHFVLNGQTYVVSAELRSVLSARLPSVGLAPSPRSIGKRLFVCNDRYGRQRALTLFPEQDPDDQMLKLAEAARVTVLLEGRGFATFVDTGIGHWEDDQQPMAAWVEEWVPGLPFDTVITTNPSGFSFTHLQRLLLDLAEAINGLRSIGAAHGAMNSRNVILFHPHPDSLNPATYFRIVDLAQAQTLHHDEVDDPPSDTLLEEDQAVVEILAQAYNALINRAEVSRSQRGWLTQLADFLIQASRDIEQGQAIQPEFLRNLARSRATTMSALPLGAATTLSDPFNFISAEHIASDELLYRIFADSCPWVDDVTRPDPCHIVGPRGCGKSTILRWVSIKAQLAGSTDERKLDQLQVGAFYVSCTAEVQSRVGRFDTLEKALSHEDALIHYLNLVILREVLSTLELMRIRNRPHWGIDDAFCQLILDFVAAQLSSSSVPVAGLPPIVQAYDLTVTHLRSAQEALRDERVLDRFTPSSFLNDLSVLLARETTFFAQHRVTYCLDDYSAHRVPESVQQVFNRVIFGLRSANYIFKISAENRGFYPYDRAGARIDVEREMKSVDFGSSFVALSSTAGGRAAVFARDLLANRLEAAGWEGTPEEILGADSMPQSEFARMARAAHLREGPRPLYSGLPCIADLCSGDMATLLLVYRRIFEFGSVTRHTRQIVPAQLQHNAIRQVSREMLQLIRSHEPYGQQMLTIAQEFCVLARFALERGQVMEHGHLEPMKRTRVEIDGLALPDLELEASVESGLVKELIRRSVFLDIGPGDARHQQQRITTRLMIRRIFLPAFQLSLAKNGQFSWTEAEFIRFLQNPVGMRLAEQRRLLRSPDAVTDSATLFSWPDGSEEAT